MKKLIFTLAIVFALIPNYVIAPGLFVVTPDIDESSIRGAGGIPTVVIRGVNSGFSLPIWSTPVNQYEEVYLISTIPPQWDGTTDFIVHICSAIQQANDTKDFAIQIEYTRWEHGLDVVPDTSTALVSYITTGDDVAWQSYESIFTINSANMSVGDMFDFRIRRIDSLEQNEIAGELAIWHTHIMYTRGDQSDLIGDTDMETFLFGFIPLFLFITFVFSRQVPMGFISGVAWFIFGVYAYTQSEAMWDNWFALFFFSCILMTIAPILWALNIRKASKEGAAEKTDKDLSDIDDSLWGKGKTAIDYSVDNSFTENRKRKRVIRQSATKKGTEEGMRGRF